MLLGGKAAQAFLGYASNVSKWRGDYAALPANWPETYKQRFEFHKKQKRVKTLKEGCCGKKHRWGARQPSCGFADCVGEWNRRQQDANLQSEAVEGREEA